VFSRVVWYYIATLIYRRDGVTKPVIYKIINLTNGKFYVGSTTNRKERFRTHRNKLRSNKHHCAHLQAAWNKYGEEAFLFHIVEEIEDESLLQAAEDAWLTEWVGKDNCYNHGLRSGAPWRGVQKEMHPSFGRVMSEGQKEVLRAARLAQQDPRTGRQHSDETKAKISAAKLANPSKHWLGKERSEETKAKIGAAQRGVAKAPRTFTPDGLARAQENMKRNAKQQVPAAFEAVHAKFPEDAQTKYDFTNAVYTGALVRIEGVICKQHGVFSQYAAQFRKGRGCPLCGADQRAESKRKQMKEFWQTEDGRKTLMEPRKHVDPN
jgi:group I intron endonuclease